LSADNVNSFLATITHHGAIDGVTGLCHQLNTVKSSYWWCSFST